MTGNDKKTNRKKRAGRLMALIMSLLLVLSAAAVPQKADASSMAKKPKAKYKLTVHNINSNTVLKRGSRIKITYTATKTSGGVTTGTKVRFKSSKKKVASVSKKGVIKARKKGTTYITVYSKSKPGKKKKIRVRVGNPVSSISVSGNRYLRVGRSSTLQAHPNSNATNKSVSWTSDNPAVATVNSDGRVKGVGNGIATVYATAKDGSGVYGARKVYVHQYLAGETHWIAHRGQHTSATENTELAFLAAAQSGGFWGCECDIWETRHVIPSMPALPGLPAGSEPVQDNGSTLPDISNLKSTVSSWPGATTMDILDWSSEVESAWKEYLGKTSGLSEEQLKLMHKEMINESGEDLLSKLFDAYRWVAEYNSIELAINHDSTFAAIWGNGNAVRNMSGNDIRAQLPGVCFLPAYLKICRDYNIVPVIEFKDPYMSSAAVKRALDLVDDYGLLEKACLISFYDGVLRDVKTQAAGMLGHDPVTYFLISDNGASNIDLASSRKYTGVSISKTLIDSNLYNRAKSYGLGVGTWTYRDQISDDERLYKHMFSNGWKLDFVTVDYHVFI